MPVKLSTTEKYRLYEDSVQSVDSDIDFINEIFKKRYKVLPKLLREDFCGTGKLACGWVEQSSFHKSWALDLSDEPMRYGKKTHLSPDKDKNVKYLKKDVLLPVNFSSDVTVAFNFSYFCFKKRDVIKKYFKNVRKGLKKKGVFILDIFGGLECHDPGEDVTDYDDYSYHWDCDAYNAINSECIYYIHFTKDKVYYPKVFSYQWRMWSLREITELLEEVGFSRVDIHWQEDDDKFYLSKSKENQESWLSYICAFV